MANNETIGSVNAAAMHGGVVLGIFSVLTLAVLRWAFTYPFCSTLFSVMLLAGPVLATVLTLQFRRRTTGEGEEFGFMRGFLFSLFMGFYASLWAALATFVYLQYFDHGTIFAAYARQLEAPEVQAYLQQSGMAAELDALSGGGGTQGFAEALQGLGAATYTALLLYLSFIAGPVIAALIGLVCKRK